MGKNILLYTLECVRVLECSKAMQRKKLQAMFREGYTTYAFIYILVLEKYKSRTAESSSV